MTREERVKEIKKYFREEFLRNAVRIGKCSNKDWGEYITDKLAELQERIEHLEKFGQHYKK